MIKTTALKDTTINGLARQIENFQNTSNLISKGSIPFYDSNNKEFSVILFFAKPLEEDSPQTKSNCVHGEQGQSNKPTGGYTSVIKDEGKQGQGTHKPSITCSGDIKNKQEKITPKQLALLKKLNYDGDTTKLTKEEARILIKEYLDNQSY